MPLAHPSSVSSSRSLTSGPLAQTFRDEEEEFFGSGVSGIVLAGSHRWGEGEFERVLRGPLIPVAQTPIICYPLEWLRAGGIRRAIVCANSETAKVRAFLGHGARVGLSIDYFEDHAPRGPAGCAHDAARRSPAHTFIVVEGALIPSLDLRALLETHRSSGAAATVVVEIDRRGRTAAAGRTRLPGGIYVFERRVLESVAERGYQDIKQGLLERLHAAGERVAMHEVQGVSPRVLDSATYASVNGWLITQATQRPMPLLAEYQAHGHGLRHPTARVHPDARLVGPVLLGAGACIEADAVVVGPASVGASSVVRAGALLSRAVVWNHCVVGEGAIVDSSLLADHSVVEAGERLFAAVQIPRETVGLHAPEIAVAPAASTPRAPVTSAPARGSGRGEGVRLPAGFVSPGARLSHELQVTGEYPAMP
jgi:NDP-sugar pyrophosphorylase family protein